MEHYWLKYGYKENGDLVCVRTLSDTKPEKDFFYNENGEYKQVKDTNVVKISDELIKKIKE